MRPASGEPDGTEPHVSAPRSQGRSALLLLRLRAPFSRCAGHAADTSRKQAQLLCPTHPLTIRPERNGEETHIGDKGTITEDFFICTQAASFFTGMGGTVWVRKY